MLLHKRNSLLCLSNNTQHTYMCLQAIEDFEMVRDKDRILVCLSGGKDSLSLLHAMHQFQFYAKKKVRTVQQKCRFQLWLFHYLNTVHFHVWRQPALTGDVSGHQLYHWSSHCGPTNQRVRSESTERLSRAAERALLLRRAK